MRNVDFTPEWYVRQQAERVSGRWQLSGLIAVVVLLVAWTYDATARARAATADRERLERVHATQECPLRKLKELGSEQTHHEQNARLLRRLRDGVPAAELIAELSHLMPSDLSLRLFMLDRITRVPEGVAVGGESQRATVLELEGVAANGRSVGNFLTDLAASPLFTTVTLEYERVEELAERQVVAFRMICHMPEFE